MQKTSSGLFQGVRQIEIGPQCHDQRIDNALITLLKGVPKSMVYRLLRTGQVRVNGRRVKPLTRLVQGDRLRIPPVRVAVRSHVSYPASSLLAAVTEAVIFEDRHFLVLDKPAGLASHGGSGMSHGAIELLRAARPNDTLELVHRLDRDTSGVLVLARTRAGLTGLQAAISAGQVCKQYLCLLLGHLSRARFDVNMPLKKYIHQCDEYLVKVSEDGKPALTFFHEIEHYRDACLVKATLQTGRTHQIRVHAAHVGNPVAGDRKYGNRALNRQLRTAGLKRLFLHATHMGFELGDRSYGFSASLPVDLKTFLDTLVTGNIEHTVRRKTGKR